MRYFLFEYEDGSNALVTSPKFSTVGKMRELNEDEARQFYRTETISVIESSIGDKFEAEGA